MEMRSLPKASAALLAIALAGLLLACQGGTSPPPQAGAPTAIPQATAEVAADLAAARQYHRNGQYEEAIALYQRLIQQGSRDTQQQARYGLAQTYLTLRQYQQAANALEAYLDNKPPQADALRARFLLGRAYAALGKADKAQKALQAYAKEEGPAAVYARLDLAELLVQADHPDKAAQELEKAQAPDLAPSLAATLSLKLADAYAAAGQDDKAIQQYDTLLQESPSDADKALALFRIATISRRLGDQSRWQQSLLDIVNLYPASPQAANALESLLAADVPLDLLAQGVVRYRQRAYTEALAAFDSFLVADPPAPAAAVAYYYRGAIRDRLDEPDEATANDEALADYEASLQLDPTGDLADDASWAHASLLEEMGLSLDAAAAYRQLWQTYPHSPFAARAAFLAGLIPYQAGDPAAAVAAWSDMLDAFPSPEQQAQAHLWLGKMDQDFFSDSEAASAHFQQALAAAPDSLYALRAEVWLSSGADATAPPEESIQAASAPAWDAAEAWLTSLWGPEEVAASPPLLSQPTWQRALELHQMGLSSEASDEFLSLIEESGSQPWRLYRLARAFHDLGLTELAARAATRLLAQSPQAMPLAQAARPLLELAYPQDYASLIQAAATKNVVSPLLILALIRQESFFNPAASSPAGALGLTQVVPATGQEIAQELDRKDFQASDLLRPLVSIDFGAYYLGSQLHSFDDNPYFALAAYNGGPGNALGWSQGAAGSDMDLFIELVGFSETRSYLKLVLENYAVYRFLYAGADHPTLVTSPAP
ncbi:MAG: transglycosylase SLT domain-containing protein [Chloroflexota bacterium]|nr:transglycosylase SLT domain-containing protein [Chloroflexota bacterium]